MVSTTFVRAAGTRVRCTRMRGSVRPSRRQRAAIDFEFLPSSAFSFLGAGENRPFETRFSEVIDRSKKELLSRYGRGVKGRSGEKSADKKGVMQCRDLSLAQRDKTTPARTCSALLLFFATQWYGNKYKIPPAAHLSLFFYFLSSYTYLDEFMHAAKAPLAGHTVRLDTVRTGKSFCPSHAR